MSVGLCPSCGAPVEFHPGAGKVKVCDYCRTVVVKAEAKLEAHGKVADLVDTESPLKLGLSGRYSDTAFTVVGRLQKGNATGSWDEWHLAFEDGRTGWLAESEGEWRLLFPVQGAALPRGKGFVAGLKPLSTFRLRDKAFVVEEVGEAHTVSAQGQLPDFNEQHRYADCTGRHGVFCTLDEADGNVEAFVGQSTTLSALGFDAHDLAPTPRREALKDARCTRCNGPLELKAPDAAKRVACPYCGALLNVAYGNLAFLKMLEKPPHEPFIPLGAKGTLADPTDPGARPVEWTCLAFLIRSCMVEGTRYPWEEYLLWNKDAGFRWLMNSSGHWTWLRPIPAGEVELSFRNAKYGGRSFKAYQEVFAVTDYVVGECYWTASVGELARATEFIDPPLSLNLDRTQSEATFTLGVLVDSAALVKAFGLKRRPSPPAGIAPAQVNPFRAKAREAWTWAGLWGLVLLALVVVFTAMSHHATYYQGRFSVPPGAAPASPEAQRFSEPFDVPDRVPLEVRIDAYGLSNNWLGVGVDLVNEATGEVIAVYGEASFYSGTEDGERWSEGSPSASVQTEVVEPGSYVLRVTPAFDPGRAVDYSVTVRADDGPSAYFPLGVAFLLLVVSLYYSLRASAFETQRWNDAVFQSAPNVSSFPYAKHDDDE
jgi:DNA-directed RNA polymerase subunit RPC12/RpoP